ncbi:mitochondrial inner membrane protease subunit 2 [Brachionus plicatilis]|uniref:Mitochondrial inner membrane protease subunit 2 n=1 Tax=Brachionus plicatilis TaxID=10195 RepID=A0A3M7S6T0_BRAPC|nr:mitochondrial inner membrane protease subunit 2 [Brachionus plicatilis]
MLKLCLKYSLITSAVFITTWDKICYFSRVDGASMQPLINSHHNKKDFVFIIRPFSFGSFFGRPSMENILQRGDVVSLISPKNPKECFLKRVVGLPGDLVRTISYKKKYVLVPEGHCWLEGDNYLKSYDSNAFGCVPMALVLGQAKAVIFPRLTPIKSDLPDHRILKKVENDNQDSGYLIDIKTNESSDYDAVDE